MEKLLRSLRSYLNRIKQEDAIVPDADTGCIPVDIVALKEHLDSDPLVPNGINRLIQAGYLKLIEPGGEASSCQVMDVTDMLHEVRSLNSPYLKL